MENIFQSQSQSSSAASPTTVSTHVFLQVQVMSPDRTLFDGEAKSVSSYNDHGPFDVLPQHENFISVIQQKLIVLNAESKLQEFSLHNGVLRVVGNKIDVFIGF